MRPGPEEDQSLRHLGRLFDLFDTCGHTAFQVFVDGRGGGGGSN